jgi:tRNA A-37 threonylcarbamoyl transferase component Bud32
MPRILAVNPRYRDLLASSGLKRVEDFLELRSVVISGHPNRNVGRVTLGSGPNAVQTFLKREHRVLGRDYFSSWRAGFGWVSRSVREARLLAALRQASVGCPEVIAVGEDGAGRAFLLLREVNSGGSLRDQLRQGRLPRSELRAALAHRLGFELAHLHASGFFHADLYSCHVLADHETGAISFLDWQRSQRRRRVGWRDRIHDLATLDATLAGELVSVRERWRCLRTYCREAGIPSTSRAAFARRIRRHAERLLRKRHVQELRDAPLPVGHQALIWLDGEAVCVTREYQQELGGAVPRWLLPVPPQPELRDWACRQSCPRPGGRDGALVQRICHRPWQWFCDWVRGRRFTTPELRQAALLFRLERYGVRVPRLLAVGQRHLRPWWTESFLLTEQQSGVDLLAWLDLYRPEDAFTAEHKRVRRVLREAGQLLRRLHDARCYLTGRLPLIVTEDGALGLSGVDELHTARQAQPGLARDDLSLLCRSLARNQTDALRVLHGYYGVRRMRPEPAAQARQASLALRAQGSTGEIAALIRRRGAA